MVPQSGLRFAQKFISSIRGRIAGRLALPEPRPLMLILYSAIGIAIVWVATEYLWGTILTGMPWGFLGHSQSPLLAMCQMADITGVYGISFWVVLINALAAMMVIEPAEWRRVMPAAAVVAILLSAIATYGLYRLS